MSGIVPIESASGVPHRIPTTGGGAWLSSRADGARLHAGVDLSAAVGHPVLAPESGVVVLVAEASAPSQPEMSRPAGWHGYGPKLLVVEGQSGVFHLLAHCGAVSVATGAAVTEGQHVADVGRLPDGGAHCHWECRSMLRPRSRAATVEICGDPAAWLRGEWSPWDGRCPPQPGDTTKTPRACRPGWRGPAPRPFQRPSPGRRHPKGGSDVAQRVAAAVGKALVRKVVAGYGF